MSWSFKTSLLIRFNLNFPEISKFDIRFSHGHKAKYGAHWIWKSICAAARAKTRIGWRRLALRASRMLTLSRRIDAWILKSTIYDTLSRLYCIASVRATTFGRDIKNSWEIVSSHFALARVSQKIPAGIRYSPVHIFECAKRCRGICVKSDIGIDCVFFFSPQMQ